MCIPSGKTFHLIPWPWPSDLWHWSLTFPRTLAMVITFDWYMVGLSYFTCVFLLARRFIWYHDLDPLIFDLLFKDFNIGYKHIYMQNTFFECSASLKFLMRQNSANFETFGGAYSDLVSLLVLTLKSLFKCRII
jgi:hypothetical protein